MPPTPAAKRASEMQREGYCVWALAPWSQEQNEVLAAVCEKVVSRYPIVGFNMHGVPLVECESDTEAAAVPDVGIIRRKSLIQATGYQFRRIAFKFFRVK